MNIRRIVLAMLAVWLVPHGVARGASPSAAGAPTFKPEELEQLVAPVALYPDPLLAQVLMASTYPLEIVEAARWRERNPALKDAALENALQQQSWDASVKSLTAFPPVLDMMNEKLDWTQKLGDAFLAQQNEVMDAVQRLRARANAEGNLTSNEQQTVTVEQAPANVQQSVTVEGQTAPPPTIISIEPASPQVVYVPTYNPTVVYGGWPYPAYPPYSYYPPGYLATSVISFGAGMAVGAALWGGCNWGWGHSDVDIDVNRYNNFNKTNISNKNWQHKAEHRKGVQYRDQATRQKYNRDTSRGAASREAFRGRAEQGRQDIARGAARDYQTRPAGGREGGSRPPGAQSGRGDVGSRPAGNRPQQNARLAGGRPPAAAQRPASAPANRGGAFDGMGNAQQARMDSARGRSSRQSAGSFGGAGGRGAGGAGGGAGRRGGGGGGRGGRR